jgi:thioredoxin 1
MAGENVKAATDQNFQTDVLGNSKPVLVDYWATWCAPCKALAPVIDEIAAQYDGKLEVYKCNIDENPESPAKFGVRGIPTVILFKGGKAVDQTVGAVPKAQLEEMINKAL